MWYETKLVPDVHDCHMYKHIRSYTITTQQYCQFVSTAVCAANSGFTHYAAYKFTTYLFTYLHLVYI